MTLSEDSVEPDQSRMRSGVTLIRQRKLGLTNRVVAGVILMTLAMYMSLVTLTRSDTKHPSSITHQDTEVVTTHREYREYSNTCHRRHQDGTRALLSKKFLAANDCQKRLPSAIVIGAKKCGTGALRVFLDTHPAVVFSEKAETKFFTQNYDRGLDWYRDVMRPTAPGQIGIEKSPGYLFSPEATRRIKEDMPETTKLIVILCDPVRRTISDFTFGQMHKIMERRQVGIEDAKVIAKKVVTAQRFEKSVLNSAGQVNAGANIIEHSLYDRYIYRWLQTFPRSKFLFVDGDDFSRNPVRGLNEIEAFLEIPSYFNASKFYFDDEKGFYCLSQPSKQCLKSTKGLEHPPVDKALLNKLRVFFKSHDHATSILALRNFTWMDS